MGSFDEGEPASRGTALESWNSPISNRRSRDCQDVFGEALGVPVLPTPVGPTNISTPTGRSGLFDAGFDQHDQIDDCLDRFALTDHAAFLATCATSSAQKGSASSSRRSDMPVCFSTTRMTVCGRTMTCLLGDVVPSAQSWSSSSGMTASSRRMARPWCGHRGKRHAASSMTRRLTGSSIDYPSGCSSLTLAMRYSGVGANMSVALGVIGLGETNDLKERAEGRIILNGGAGYCSSVHSPTMRQLAARDVRGQKGADAFVARAGTARWCRDQVSVK